LIWIAEPFLHYTRCIGEVSIVCVYRKVVYSLLKDQEIFKTPDMHNCGHYAILIQVCRWPAGGSFLHQIEVANIWERLRTGEVIRFRQYLSGAHSRLEIIVSFMAVLEMVKQGMAVVQQSELFGDIVIEGRPDPQPPEELVAPPAGAEPENQ